MRIKQMKIEEIKPYQKNPRKIPDKAIKKVANSIKEFGFQQPIVVDNNNVIIVGHTRLMAAKDLNLDKVPVLVAKDLSAAQVKAYRLADNRTNQEAEWDNDFLINEIKDLIQDDFEIELTGFEDSEIDEFMSGNDEFIGDEDDIPDVKNNTISTIGDLWLLGDHKLLCGDATKIDDVEKVIGEKKVDIVFTDPPYNLELDCCIINSVIENGNVFVFQNDRQTISYLKTSEFQFVKFFVFYHSGCAIPQEGGKEPFLRHILISHEKIGNAIKLQTRNGLSSVIKSEYRNQKDVHEHAKPVEVVENIIKAYSKKNDIVFDPFGGSGTTLIACEKNSRRCRMIEISPNYCDVIIRRWQEFTSKEAVHENQNKFNDMEAMEKK